MQIAARQPVWCETGTGGGILLTMRFTAETGKYVSLWVDALPGAEPVVNWGDGERQKLPKGASGWFPHTYRAFGKYVIRVKDSSFAGFTVWDSSSYAWSDALISVVDKGGTYSCARSGAYKNCTNLETVVLPAPCVGMGQRVFAGCTSLRHASIPGGTYFYDGTFQDCPLLESLEFRSSDTLWLNVFRGCLRLRRIDLGTVYQIAGSALSGCPALEDVWIGNHTVEQVLQRARMGSVTGGSFPWGAGGSVRFHCTDGIVLGNGTVIGE